MVDLTLLKERGVHWDHYKELFRRTDSNFRSVEGDRQIGEYHFDENPDQTDKINHLIYRIRTRIQQGRENNIENHRVYHALDLAWDTPFRQLPPTLLQSLMDSKPDDESVHKALSAWGFNLNEVLMEVDDPKTHKKIKKLNVPAFFNVFVPIVRAYVTIRLATIMNERDRIPFLRYTPFYNSKQNRAKCDALTSRVERMSKEFGFYNMVKQAVFQMLHYSFCVMFPIEEWYTEYQEDPTSDTVDPNTGKPVRLIKEGIRYHTPHPSRTFFDEAHRPSTFNTNTGCEYAGYWRVLRYSDIKNNPNFINTDSITVGNTDWWTQVGTVTFFNTVYNGCTIKGLPVAEPNPKDRETKFAEQLYVYTRGDQPVLFTEYYEKLVPSENGLGDYDYPVWFRFVVGGWDTILYASPVPYTPPIWMGYDYDEMRSSNPSLSMELLPFQDQFSNLLTQYLLAVKQNLANVTFVDTDVVHPNYVEKLRNWGEKIWRHINYIPFSSKKAIRTQQNIPQAFISHEFSKMNTQELIQAMGMVLDTMERVMVMSNQELGRSATHEQTRYEVASINQSTNTRLTFTAHVVDEALETVKQQAYEGLMAYGEEEFWAEVPRDQLVDRQQLEAWGFTVDENNFPDNLNGETSVPVKLRKKHLAYHQFASNRKRDDRPPSVEAGVGLLNTLQGLLGSALYDAIGPDQFIELINLSMEMMGFPVDAKLKVQGEATGPEQQQEQLLQLIEQIKSQIMPEIQEGLTPVLERQKEIERAVTQNSNQIQQLAETQGGLREFIKLLAEQADRNNDRVSAA